MRRVLILLIALMVLTSTEQRFCRFNNEIHTMATYCSLSLKYCYICGKYLWGKQRNFCESLQKTYFNCFKISVPENVFYTPAKCCPACRSFLLSWDSENRKKKPFETPMIWTDPGEHIVENCYFCLNKPAQGSYHKKAKSLVYNGTIFAILPSKNKTSE